jgi:hypothetical protein
MSVEELKNDMQEFLYYYFGPAPALLIRGDVPIPGNLSKEEELDWLYDNDYISRQQRPNDYFFWNLYKNLSEEIDPEEYNLMNAINPNDLDNDLYYNSKSEVDEYIRILYSMEGQGYSQDIINEFRSFIEPHIDYRYKREARNVLAAKHAGLLKSNNLNRIQTNNPALNKVIGLAPFITTTTGYLMNEYRTNRESKGTVDPALRNRRRRIEGLPVEPPRKPGTGTGGGKGTRKNIKRKGTRRNKY